MRYSRRAILSLGAASLGLAGCASTTVQLVAAEAKSVFASGKQYKYGLSPEEIDGFDYPTLGARIGDGDPFILILAEANGEDSLWASSDHQFFWFRGPRLVRTSGLLVDLAEVSWRDKQDPVTEARTLILTNAMSAQGQTPLTQRGFVDLSQSDSSPIRSEVKIGAAAAIEVNARNRQTRVVDEHWDATSWRWKTSARFWIDPTDGTLWRSLQHYAPAMQPIEFELIRSFSA